MTAVKFSSKYVPLFQKLTNVRTLDTQTIIDFIVVGFVVDIVVMFVIGVDDIEKGLVEAQVIINYSTQSLHKDHYISSQSVQNVMFSAEIINAIFHKKCDGCQTIGCF